MRPTPKPDFEQHGGNLAWINLHFPNAPTPPIDLSTGINPYGYPLPAPENAWHYTLPDEAFMRAAYEAVAPEHNVALASGMQPLMVALAALRLKQFGISNVAIASPTYSEHESVWSALGHHCAPYSEGENYDVVIICNPNNPDGRAIPSKSLLRMANQKVWLIVDESFGDMTPECSMADAAQNHGNIIVLRSYGKFFGLAGMRISAAITSSMMIGKLRVLLGPWPISTAACHLLPTMLKNQSWMEAMRLQLHQEAIAWRNILANHFYIVGYTDLFTLVEIERAEDWFTHLASQGILVRRFAYNKRWLRFSLPHNKHLQRLEKALNP